MIFPELKQLTGTDLVILKAYFDEKLLPFDPHNVGFVFHSTVLPHIEHISTLTCHFLSIIKQTPSFPLKSFLGY